MIQLQVVLMDNGRQAVAFTAWNRDTFEQEEFFLFFDEVENELVLCRRLKRAREILRIITIEDSHAGLKQ